MNVHFDALDIDNSAIFIVIDQLAPFLKYDPDSEFRVLDDPNEKEEYKVLYEQVFIPYCKEEREHFYYHHNDYVSNDWMGEQACLSMIHAINQKAWWLLYYYSIREAVKEYCKVSEEKLNRVSLVTTCHILDGDYSIDDAVEYCVSEKLNLDIEIAKLIINKIKQKILKYEETSSRPMRYR